MSRPNITNICGVGIIYRKNNPKELFCEMKDNGYPIKLGRGQLCFIGGNWIGESAKSDKNPFHTYCRELNEELTFSRPIRNSSEYAALGISDNQQFAPTTINAKPTQEDIEELAHLKQKVISGAIPFQDWIHMVEKSALDSADPQNQRQGFTALCSYYSTALNESEWNKLMRLSQKFGNLSSESQTLFISLEEIVKKKVQWLFGHGQALQSFFMSLGFQLAKKMPTVANIKSTKIGKPLGTYQEYLKRYDVEKKPV